MVCRVMRRKWGILLALLLATGALVPAALTTPVHAGVVVVVNSTGDQADADLNNPACDAGGGQCTLRAAIQQTNTTGGTDFIFFEIGAGGLQTIMPGSALPAITNPVTLDATTQNGYSGTPLIEITGTNAGDVEGLVLSANNSTIEGLIINGFAGIGGGGRAGILITGNDNAIKSNFVGLDDDGATKKANWWGVRIQGSLRNVVGGTAPSDRNVVSGNTGTGVLITGSSAEDNLIQGNYIGTDHSGTLAVGNGGGVNVHNGNNNSVGTPGGGNLISGNLFNVAMQQSTRTLVAGNLIGTAASGLSTLSGNGIGISIFGGSDDKHLIGGSQPADRNVIAGNGTGIKIDGEGSVIRGNYIGVGSDGTTPLPNGVGIDVLDDKTPPTDILIGGIQPGEGNRIWHNNGDGISLLQSDAGPIQIVGNSIFSNGGLGIDLNDNGVNPNDDQDPDTGANTLQNFPNVNYVAPIGGNTIIRGVLKSTPSTTFRIELFSSSSADPTGFGEGASFLGSVQVQTDTTGRASFKSVLESPLQLGHFVTATATDPSGNTSEFSGARRVCTILGTSAAEELSGTEKNDVICGLGGKDVLRGKEGNDVLLGGAGNDTQFGSVGRDVLEGGSGGDDLDGGPNKDVCRQGAGTGSLTNCEVTP